MIQIQRLNDNPPNDNPFWHDNFNMGHKIAENVYAMFATFPSQKASFLIVINTETGERVKLTFGPGNLGHWDESHDSQDLEEGVYVRIKGTNMSPL